MLRELGEHLIEVHGQHETVGLLDARTHRGLLDAYANVAPKLDAVRKAWRAWRLAVTAASELRERAARASAEAQDLGERLATLDRLDPHEGEEIALAEERALLGAAEKALADIAAAGEALGGDTLTSRLSHAARALERARERATQSGAGETNTVIARLKVAAEAVERAPTGVAWKRSPRSMPPPPRVRFRTGASGQGGGTAVRALRRGPQARRDGGRIARRTRAHRSGAASD